MSETTPESPEAKGSKESKDGKAGADAAPAAAAPALPVLIGVIAGALALGGTLGALLIGPPLVQVRQKATLAARIAAAEAGPDAKKHGKDKKKGKDGEHGGGEAGKSPVYRIDNVIVNPAGSMGQRFLMCSVAVELEDEEFVEVLRTRDIEVRDIIISTLESNSLAQLTQPGARDSLRHRLASALHPVLGEAGADAHLRVFLPQFVIQ